MRSSVGTALDMSDDGEPLAELRRCREQQRALERRIAEQVRRARGRGHSWQAIGSALDISKQAAHKKFGKH